MVIGIEREISRCRLGYTPGNSVMDVALPVLYPSSIVPERLRFLYGMNPMAGVIEGFRWAILGKANPDWKIVLVSAGVVLVLLVGGIIFFRRVERTFADVI